MDADGLQRLIAQFRECRLIVVGDLVLDRFVWGRVDRISPEAPVPVVEVERITTHPGGAANVAANLVSLGVDVVLLGVVGEDGAGRDLKRQLEDRRIPADGVLVDSSRPTTLKSRVMAHQQQICRTDREDCRPVSNPLADRVHERFSKALDGAGAVILSDYAKGVLTPELCRRLIRSCRDAGVPVAVDPKSSDFSRYAGATIITPNFPEFQQAVSVPLQPGANELSAAVALIEEARVEALLVTRGEEGMTLFHEGRSDHIRTLAKEVFDVTGAGDTVISTLSCAMACGASFHDASVLANMAAGAVVAKLGTAVVTLDELMAGFES